MIVALILTELVKRVSDKRVIKFLQNLCFCWLQSGNKYECGKDISIAAYVELLRWEFQRTNKDDLAKKKTLALETKEVHDKLHVLRGVA